MKIWFLADLHFGCRADNEIWLKDYSDYFYNVFIPLLKEKYEEGDIVCSLGDVFDNRSSVGINTINVVIDIFEKIAESISTKSHGNRFFQVSKTDVIKYVFSLAVIPASSLKALEK